MKRYRPRPVKTTDDDENELMWSSAPNIWCTYRTVDRAALLRALVQEYVFGDSLSKCYVALLARTIVDQAPELLKKDGKRGEMSKAEYYLRQCGVKRYDPNRLHTEVLEEPETTERGPRTR